MATRQTLSAYINMRSHSQIDSEEESEMEGEMERWEEDWSD